jgi:hypothetical protein
MGWGSKFSPAWRLTREGQIEPWFEVRNPRVGAPSANYQGDVSQEDTLMNFRISGLPVEPFLPLFGLSDSELAARGAKRIVADAKPGYPDRIELRDADPSEAVILVNYEHQSADTPYRSRHAIFVLEGADAAYDRVGEIPEVLRPRQISLRAFDERHMMVDADLCDGHDVESAIERLFAMPEASYLHAHYAKRGCYAALIGRV